MVRKRDKLVYGWGIVDVDYSVYKTEELPRVVGKRNQNITWRCPYYVKWCGILQRCLCPKLQERHHTYKGCTVTEEWKYLSNFIKWVDSQPNGDWINCEPDKDFLSEGNKQYSPETVVFVSKKVNQFIVDSGKTRGECLIGVSHYPERAKNPYLARCRNPFGSSSYVGIYMTEIEAHKAWQARKHQHACHLADLQSDERIASRLREMYAPDKDWTNR